LCWLQVKDLGLVIAVGGAVLGSTIVYILPALMFLFNMRRKAKAGATFTKAQKLEVLANKALVVVGAALGVVGVYTCLK
jgi:membrane protein YqaA with SNARE-associated domain